MMIGSVHVSFSSVRSQTWIYTYYPILYTFLVISHSIYFYVKNALTQIHIACSGAVRGSPGQAPDRHPEGRALRGHAQPLGLHVPRRGQRRSGQANGLPARRRVAAHQGPDRGQRGQVRPAQHHLVPAR